MGMEKKVSWDDIPSLDGLGVDWEYQPETLLDKRAFVRLGMGAVCRLVEVREIVVRLVTPKQQYEGPLVDVGAGGCALSMPVLLAIDSPVKVGFFLGSAKIISRGLVRHANAEGGRFITGIQFIDLAPASAEYIAGLYAAKVFSHAV